MIALLKRSNLILIVGLLSLILSLIGSISNTTRFFQSYLFSFLFWIDLPMGALALLMMFHLTGGTWGAVTRRILEATSDTLPWMAPLFLPILFGISRIYTWTEGIESKQIYLNTPAYAIRALIYFSCWITLNLFLQKDAAGRLKRLSAGGLILYVFTSTFAAIDWQMSVEPHWYSTIYGLIYASAQALLAFAVTLFTFATLSTNQKLTELLPKKTLRDLGNLLLAMVMVWAYLSFMQYLVIWSGNLPEEVTWFVHRTQGGWQILAILLLIIQFGLPFSALLFRGVKDQVQILGSLGVLIFFTRIIDRYWTLMPGFYPEGISFHWLDLTTFLTIGSVWILLFLRRLDRTSIFAFQDPDWPLIEPSKVSSHG